MGYSEYAVCHHYLDIRHRFNQICRTLQAKMPHFERGISPKNVAMAAEIIKKLDFHGLLALSWDDTDLEKSLSVWDEGDDIWVVHGGSKGPIRVTSAEAVDTLFKDPELQKADKVCHLMSLVTDLPIWAF
jgi:hypothetical protein